MTMMITRTSMCVCRHIASMHNEGEDCLHPDCSCPRFNVGSRKSSSRYRRGQPTVRKRVARLEVGDIVLVGYPGHHEPVLDADGRLMFERVEGSVTSAPRMRHVQDEVLRAVQLKSGALLARVTGRHLAPEQGGWGISPFLHIIETNLGDLAGMSGTNSVFVLIGVER